MSCSRRIPATQPSPIIADCLCMMAGMGTRAPEKLAAYAGYRARFAATSKTERAVSRIAR